MKPGHADAQFMFLEMGKALGFGTRLTWTRPLPTDGVWLARGDKYLLPELPVAALEVAVSEGPKAIKGSIDTLAEVSPSLGVFVLNDMEIRRGAIRKGEDSEKVERRLRERLEAAEDRALRHQQRLEIWTYEELVRRYRLATGAVSPPLLDRITATNSTN